VETGEKIGEGKENKTGEGCLTSMFVTFDKNIVQHGSRDF
jgi:hypothetical protein